MLEAAEIGGLGIHLVRRFSSAQAYERVNGVNRLVLQFNV
jgi:anti-sigma regulatory factor (Ser/Thr protein kinase)